MALVTEEPAPLRGFQHFMPVIETLAAQIDDEHQIRIWILKALVL
jgi:hypothetical protein